MLDPIIRRPGPAGVLFVLLAAGCGTKYYPVEGKVVWADGSPAKEIQGSQIVFESAELKLSARGSVGPDGGFTMTTENPGDGIPAGTYKVAIVEMRKGTGPDGGTLAPGQLDPKYYDLASSGLTATVTTGKNPITLTVDRAKKK